MDNHFCSSGLNIRGQIERLYSGSINYWRLDYRLWDQILDNVKELGFDMIETYIPWQVHELAKGLFDFGATDPNKNLPSFLDLCHQKSLHVIVRPGPHINAEMTYFGYPQRIVLDPAIQALTSLGTPYIMPYFIKQFPVPSYASRKLYEEAAVFFDALAPLLKSRLDPDGPIVAIQSDNETTYFFMLEPYILDYSPDSLDLYRQFLKTKYHTIANLKLIYRNDYQNFDQVNPPTGFTAAAQKDLPYFFDWCEYKEYQIIYANERISKMWKERGIDLPTFHNMAADNQFHQTPYDLSGMEKSPFVDLVGIDCYNTKEEYRHVKNRVKFLSGTSLLPFIPEFGSGSWYSRDIILSPAEEEFIYLYAYMHGLKAINFYMLVERERWQGCPITRSNQIRTGYYQLFKKIGAFIAAAKLETLRKKREIVMIRDYDIGRLKMLETITDLPNLPGMSIPKELFEAHQDFGFQYLDPKLAAEEAWIDDLARLFENAGVDFDFTNTHVAPRRLKDFPIAVLPTFDFIATETVAKILAYVQAGGILIIGPGIPYLDQTMKPYHPFAQFDFGNPPEPAGYGKGQIYLAFDPQSLFQVIHKLGIKGDFVGEGVEVTSFIHPETGRKLIFAANPGEISRDAKIRFCGKLSFKALINCSDVMGSDTIQFPIKGYTVCAWEVLSA